MPCLLADSQLLMETSTLLEDTSQNITDQDMVGSWMLFSLSALRKPGGKEGMK